MSYLLNYVHISNKNTFELWDKFQLYTFSKFMKKKKINYTPELNLKPNGP